jgi:hypothetical protein
MEEPKPHQQQTGAAFLFIGKGMSGRDVRRFDTAFTLGDASARAMATKFEKTAEGFLQGRAVLTSVGVFTYKRADGTTVAELRLPEEVFNADTMNSMNGKPITNDHPASLVTADNAKELQVGSIGSNPSSWIDSYALSYKEQNREGGTTASDGIHVANDLLITDGATIDEIIAGKRALSMGYTCDIEDAEGVWAGVEYNAIQRNIKYNHLAIVDKARAGDAAVIHLDSADAIQIENTNKQNPYGGKSMKKINLDGIEYEGEDRLVEMFAATKKRADEAEAQLTKKEAEWKADTAAKISAMEADRDTHKERADAAEAKVKELEAAKLDEAKLDAAIEARVGLLESARLAGVEVKKTDKAENIKKAVVTAVFPKANFDGKTSVYIDARYDAAVEALADRADNGAPAGDMGIIGSLGGQRSDSAAAARERMINAMKGVKEAK